MAKEYKKENQFRTRWYHRNPSYWFRKDRERPDGFRASPEVVRFDVDPHIKPNGKPPVRIFLGTEPAQARAERIFIWSVKQVRDPARAYEIYLMKDLAGYDRRGWKTGFTNYRYAIPAMAGGTGRAIYNDVDQIYLADPGEMFDLDMKGAGVLGITERETSVILIDCDKMIKFWTEKNAKTGSKHAHFRDALHDNKLWGKLPAEWNARDEEFTPEQSKCFHFTTLQTQPWQPFPDQLRYAPHPNGKMWFDLEDGADRASFTAFTREKPSRGFREIQGDNKPRKADSAASGHEGAISALMRETGAKTLLAYGAPIASATQGDANYPFSAKTEGRFGGVAMVGMLTSVPEDDVAWVLDELFGAAESFVYAAVACHGKPGGQSNIQTPEWWKAQFERAAKRRPGIQWQLSAEESPGKQKLLSGAASIAKAA